MIKKIDIKDIAECVNVIRESFLTVFNFNFTCNWIYINSAKNITAGA